jgi:hypothetical protein
MHCRLLVKMWARKGGAIPVTQLLQPLPYLAQEGAALLLLLLLLL